LYWSTPTTILFPPPSCVCPNCMIGGIRLGWLTFT
jgi:hypothetical protein